VSGVLDFHIHIRTPVHRGVWSFIREINPGLEAQLPAFASREGVEAALAAEGVDQAVVIPEVLPFSEYRISAEWIAEYCRGSDRLIPFAHFNPFEERDPVETLRRQVEGLGCRGLKLLPSYQLFPLTDRRLYPVYEAAQGLGIPVMFHCGSSVFDRTVMRFCDPIQIDDLCADFPDLAVVAAHGGRGFWYREVAFLTRLHRNLYFDVAGLPPQNLPEYFPDLPRLTDRILFGTDWPVIPRGRIRPAIQSIRALPIPPAAMDAILGGTARRLLRLA
jgi:uncharacterized protein